MHMKYRVYGEEANQTRPNQADDGSISTNSRFATRVLAGIIVSRAQRSKALRGRCSLCPDHRQQCRSSHAAAAASSKSFLASECSNPFN